MQFTVIVPIYKVEAYLERCIDSILAQTFGDFECLLVDDGSPDRCPEICDAYAKKDPRIRVIHKPNGGLVSARNAGIFAAKGDYITYVDGDDWIKPNLLQFVHDRIAESTAPVDMVIFSADMIFADHVEPMTNRIQSGWYDKERLRREVYPYLIMKSYDRPVGHTIEAYTWCKPCRRELQVEHYVRDEGIRAYTDVPLTYECLLNCENVYICDESLYCYNQMNENSILTQLRKNRLTKSFARLCSYMQEHLSGYDPSVDDQLIEYPAWLITGSAKTLLRTEPSFRQAVQSMKEGLKESGLLQFIHLRDLFKHRKVVGLLLFKLHIYYPTMLLLALKMRLEDRMSK